MATLTEVTLTCDLCGDAKDVQTRALGLDGTTYEIDLCPKDSGDLSKAAAGYVSKGRKSPARHGPQHNGQRPRSRDHTATTSDRARASNKKNSDQGRAADPAREESKTSRPKQKAAKADGARAQSARPAQDETRSGRSEALKAKAARKRAAELTGSRREKGIYVYGIFPADIEVAAEMPGVGEHPGPIRVVRSNGLAALISEVDPSGRLGSPDDLAIHTDMLDAAVTEVPVVPLRFGTVLSSEEAVAEDLLAAHREEFTEALEDLEGRAEFVVRGRYVEQVPGGEVLSAKREKDTRALLEAMKEHCVASAAREPAHELDAVHVAFLVEADEERDVEQVIEDLVRQWEGRVEVQLLGPMAAYDFAEIPAPQGKASER